jgi:cytochrome c
MNSMTLNNVLAGLLVGGLTAMLSGFIAGKLVHVEELEQAAYFVDTGAAGAEVAEEAEEALPPIAPLLAAASPENGEKLSRVCTSCHTFNQGGRNGTGPNQWDVVGSKKGHVDGFAYSDALIATGGTWSYESLNQFLANPKKYAPGTKMNFAGVRKEQDRADLIAWLRTLSDNPVPLPDPAAAAPAEPAAPADGAAPEAVPAAPVEGEASSG